MTLKQLEAFYWAATCASFTMAAERLRLSTSTLSKRLVELEQSVEATLFDRSGYKAVLTDAGQRLLPRARALLVAAEEARTSLGADTSLGGRCLFGVGELSALTWLPRLVAHVKQHYPDLRLEPHVEIGRCLHERLLNGELDCAVIAGRSPHASIVSRPIAEVRFAWAAAPSLMGRSATFHDALLDTHPVVTLPPGSGTMSILDEWLMARKLDAPHRLTCNSWGAIAGMLVGGMGVGFLPESWARSLARRGELKLLKAEPRLSALTYTLQRRRDDDRPLHDAMLASVLASADFRAAPRLL